MADEPAYVTAAREYQRRYYQERREEKVAYQNQYYWTNRDKIRIRRRELRIEKGLPVKGETVVPGGFVNKKHYNRQHYLLRMAEVHFRDRVAVLQTVSKSARPVCCKCGDSDIRSLTVNHINGGGRKELAADRTRLFRKAVLSGARSVHDLDVRCFNCNIIYEYERGRRRLPDNWEEILAELTDGGV
jgi:hypothetical protein